MVAWTESAVPSGKGEQIFMVAVWAEDSGKPLLEVSAFMEGPNYIVNDRPVKAIVPFKNVHHTPVRNDRNRSEVTDTTVSPSACEDDKP